MTICPCCGFKSNIELRNGCACGARSVGEPLPRPDLELPSYGRSLVLVLTGALIVLLFLTETIIALSSLLPLSEGVYAAGGGAIDFWTWVAAGQTAAWRLKWVMIPITIGVLWFGRRLYRSVVASPERFCGQRYARRGLIASVTVPLLVVVLIGLTVPERLRRRQESIDARNWAYGYRIGRALDQYRVQFETLPGDLKDLSRLPDPDGSLAEALKNLDSSAYKPSADLAAAAKQKPRALRGAVILNASTGAADDTLTQGLSFTNYELRLPGSDKIQGTDDDLIVRDGLIELASETPRRLGSTTVSPKATKP